MYQYQNKYIMKITLPVDGHGLCLDIISYNKSVGQNPQTCSTNFAHFLVTEHSEEQTKKKSFSNWKDMIMWTLISASHSLLKSLFFVVEQVEG